MLSKFKHLVIGPPPVDEPPPDPSRAGMVLDMAENSWITGLIPGAESLRFPYSRPEFLLLVSEDEIAVSGDQSTRPVLVPKDPRRLPMYAGYAETINAGKTPQNEDQASAKVIPVVSKRPSMTADQFFPSRPDEQTPGSGKGRADEEADEIAVDAAEWWDDYEQADEADAPASKDDDELLPVQDEPGSDSSEVEYAREEAVCFGVFDGHAGTGAALMASNCLHEHIKSKLANVLDLMLLLDQQEKILGYKDGGEASENILALGTLGGKKLTRDSLVVGALETAFVDMDDQIQEEKYFWKIPGGCAALLALFFMRHLYIANAGDCRALLITSKGETRQLSTDFTPDAERRRLQQIAYVYPEFMGRHFSRFEYSRRLCRRDLRKRVLYRDWYMSGWAQKTVKETDLRHPLISTGPKKPRLLNTIGVTRGFGDHHLVTVNHAVPIKPFLSPIPEVQVVDLSDLSIGDDDVLVLASDGLWDVLSNEVVAAIVRLTLEQYPGDDPTRYTLAAQDLVVTARGQRTASGPWRRSPSAASQLADMGNIGVSPASTDDVTVFVIPLKYALAPPEQDEDDELLKAM